MSAIIHQQSYESKSSSYRSSSRRLTKLEYNLLKVIYDDHLIQGFTERDHTHFGIRFKRHPKTIAKALRDLVSYGFITSKKQGRGHASLLCITQAGFFWSENQPLPQTLPHNSSIPYIDLFKKEEVDPLLKEQQICEQLPELEPPPPQEEIYDKLDDFFEKSQISYQAREEIKTKLNQSRIGPVRKERLVERIIARPIKKLPIHHPRSFFLRCIQNEEKELQEIFNIFRGKNPKINLYAQQ